MLSETTTIQKLEVFLKTLRQGGFADETTRAFEQLNIYILRYDNARIYLRDKYLPELYAEGKIGQQQMIFIADRTLENTVPSLAFAVTESLISLYAQNEDE